MQREGIGSADRQARPDSVEAALHEALEDRARLWEQAHRAQALEHELEELRRRIRDIEDSPSWRLTAPMRRLTDTVRPRARTVVYLARKARARLRA